MCAVIDRAYKGTNRVPCDRFAPIIRLPNTFY
jgi:hypothetical protein